jgi:hypothetical protein
MAHRSHPARGIANSHPESTLRSCHPERS